MEHKAYKSVNQSVRKKDAMQLLTGKPVYTDDVTPGNALVVKILRSPHANAIVDNIDTSIAKKIPGVVDVYTWQDVPKKRFAIAGQTYPDLRHVAEERLTDQGLGEEDEEGQHSV